MRNHTVHRIVSGALALAVLSLGYWFFAPTAIGGSATYVVTDGISMQPRFHAGDLAIVRGQSSYHVGQIVGYRSRLLHTIVLHRIIGTDRGRYIFKGDNNNFVDLEHPARSQLVGKLWLHVPGLGGDLGPLRRPGSIVLAATFGLLLFLSNLFTTRRRRRGSDGRRARAKIPRPRLELGEPSGLAIFGTATGIFFGLLSIVALAQPVRASVPLDVPYAQSGTFAYSAASKAGAAYPDGRVRTGDPFFLRLVRDARFTFAYRFTSPSPHRVHGTAGLVAQLASTTGWSRTVTLARPTAFTGDAVTVHGSMNMRSLGELIARLEASTQVISSYTVTLTPTVRIAGAAGTLPVHSAFAPPLSFSLTSDELEPTLPNSVGHPTTPDPTNPMTPKASGSISGSQIRPESILGIRVDTARTISLGGLVLALCILGYAFRPGRIRVKTSETEKLRNRYRSMVVPIAGVQEPAAVQRVVDVADMDALVKIAARYDRMILHEAGDDTDAYSVADDGVLYRFAASRELEVVELLDRIGGPPAPSVARLAVEWPTTGASASR
jgi:signal peptidase I